MLDVYTQMYLKCTDSLFLIPLHPVHYLALMCQNLLHYSAIRDRDTRTHILNLNRDRSVDTLMVWVYGFAEKCLHVRVHLQLAFPKLWGSTSLPQPKIKPKQDELIKMLTSHTRTLCLKISSRLRSMYMCISCI